MQPRIRVVPGDCRTVMRELADAGASFDAIVTDPPYHLTTGKLGGSGPASASTKTPHGRARIGAGFMGKAWDGGDVAFQAETWRAAYDLLKPGGHLLAFGGTRTYHRLAVAIEDAGFEIRDSICWLYGTGFPKSLDVAKALDKAAGVTGGRGGPKTAAHAGWIERGRMRGADNEAGWQRPWMAEADAVDAAARTYLPATAAAREWQGWGTALKPAFEPIIVARKPLCGTVAANVLAHGCGALNIDASRVPAADKAPAPRGQFRGSDVGATGLRGLRDGSADTLGRWPANVIHDGSAEVEDAFARFGERTSGKLEPHHICRASENGSMSGPNQARNPRQSFGGDTGSAARFYYSAKASKAERAGSKHPTVKPLALMRYLCKLVTPPGGHVLDPFAGSGSTLQAAAECGFLATGIELTAEYRADIRRRAAAFAKAERRAA